MSKQTARGAASADQSPRRSSFAPCVAQLQTTTTVVIFYSATGARGGFRPHGHIPRLIVTAHPTTSGNTGCPAPTPSAKLPLPTPTCTTTTTPPPAHLLPHLPCTFSDYEQPKHRQPTTTTCPATTTTTPSPTLFPTYLLPLSTPPYFRPSLAVPAQQLQWPLSAPPAGGVRFLYIWCQC